MSLRRPRSPANVLDAVSPAVRLHQGFYAGRLVAVWMLLCFTALANADLPNEAARLEQLRVELDVRRAALADLDNQERSLVESLGQIDDSLARLVTVASETDRALATLRAQVATLQESVGHDEARLLDVRSRLRQRLRVLFVEGQGSGLRALLGAADYTTFALRMKFSKQLAQADAALVDERQRIEQRIAEQRSQLRAAIRAVEETIARSAAERTLLEQARAERRTALERIAHDRQLALRYARDLQMRHAALTHVVRELAASKDRRPLTAAVRRVGVLKTGLHYPVDGLVIRHFGAIKERETGAEIVSNGVEFRAEQGAAVVAAADGRIAHVGWMRGFGRVVIVDHGDGHHTISAHLSHTEVSAGDEVSRGQLIGAVGDTESPNGPKLYFELRENGIPRDPAPLLR